MFNQPKDTSSVILSDMTMTQTARNKYRGRAYRPDPLQTTRQTHGQYKLEA